MKHCENIELIKHLRMKQEDAMSLAWHRIHIPEKDLYVEFNGNWTHGFHPFDEKNEKDAKRLSYMVAKKSKYYDKAIYVWTVLDPKKRLTAKQNDLKFIEFWNLEEVKTWLSSQAV